jgi:UDP-N-acetylglucosamine 4,6-dehydratase/5-epimerase
MITLEQGVNLVWTAFDDAIGGEVYVRKIPSMSIGDVAKACVPEAEHKIIGIRPGESCMSK